MDLALARGPDGAQGVYMVARVDRVEGLPLRVEPLYVGKTSRRFKRRLEEHFDPWRSHSAELNQSLRARDTSTLELWVREARGKDVDRLERDLIRRLKPPLNKILYEKE